MIQVAYSDTTPGVAQTYDAFGRSLGYTYAKDGSVQQTVGTSYDAASGRIATASFLHGGATKTFSYNYLAGTPLLASLACPSNLTIEHAYEAGRDLVAGITIRRGAGTNVVLRNYTYDTLARPLTRLTSRNGTTQNDTFGYNSRSELVSATLGNDNYSYGFDAIGNRATSSEAGTQSTYSANNLNQYTSITPSSSSLQEEGDRAEGVVEALTYDADGNATLIRTSTGTWTISYNAENRPIRFENAGTQTVVECAYDSQGRRFEKKVTVAGTTTLHHRYIYRGYLQIAALDLTRAAHPALWLVTWDPSQPTATRPLAIQKDGTWFTYGYDITKNVCELFGPNGYIRTAYSYTPFGSVSASENGVVQNFQWSSEFYDSELDLVYYNYRHYSPAHGRFLSRDPIQEQGGWNLYIFVGNNSSITDYLGEAQHGCNNVTHSEFQNLSDEEVNRRYEELSRKKQRTRADNEMLRKLKAEQKGRLLRHSRMKLLGSRCKGGFATPQAMAVQIICTLVAMYMESELEKAIEDDGGSEDLLALSANCSRGIDGLWRCSCPSGTTAYGAGDLSCKTFTNRPLIMCIKHNADIPINWLIGLVESNNLQSIKNENCCKAQETTCGTY